MTPSLPSQIRDSSEEAHIQKSKPSLLVNQIENSSINLNKRMYSLDAHPPKCTEVGNYSIFNE